MLFCIFKPGTAQCCSGRSCKTKRLTFGNRHSVKRRGATQSRSTTCPEIERKTDREMDSMIVIFNTHTLNHREEDPRGCQTQGYNCGGR